MATTVTVYKSTDAGAPVLKGPVVYDAAFGYINVLDKCLVTGYGAKAAAGWTKPYTAAGKAAFKQGGGNGFYLQIRDDDGTPPSYWVHLNGYETMTAIDTGTGPFPLTGSSVLYTVDGTDIARPWIVVADDRTVYAFTDKANNLQYPGFMFGDIYSYKAADAYRTVLIGGAGGESTLAHVSTSLADSTSTHYIARSYTGAAGALEVGKHGDAIKSSGTTTPLGLLPYPNPADSKIWLCPMYIHETAALTVRGKMRGFWQWLHPVAGIADGDTWPGAGALAGKTFMAIRDPYSSIPGVFVIETSSTWDTN